MDLFCSGIVFSVPHVCGETFDNAVGAASEADGAAWEWQIGVTKRPGLLAISGIW